jgi:hypothetical protein
MAKIITPGKLPPKFDKFYICTCDKCGCVAEYDEYEVKRMPIPPFPVPDRDLHKFVNRSYVKCAFCTEIVTLKDSDVEVIERKRESLESLWSKIANLFK